MEVQTRNKEGALRFFGTIKEAFDHAKEDLSVWKISWTNEPTNERVRMVRKVIVSAWDPNKFYAWDWMYEPIDIEAMLDDADEVPVEPDGYAHAWHTTTHPKNDYVDAFLKCDEFEYARERFPKNLEGELSLRRWIDEQTELHEKEVHGKGA